MEDGYLTLPRVQAHVEGQKTLGFFPLADEETALVCFDIDTRDLGPVYALTGVLDPLPYVVEDTGGRGRHVWVFFATPQPAEEVLAWAKSVLTTAGIQAEVYGPNKKLIRLPFGVNRKTGQRSRVLVGEFKTLDRVPEVVQDSRVTTPETHGDEGGWLAAMWNGDSSPSNGRNNTLNRFYWWLLRRGFPQDLARELCERANNGFNPPLDEAEFAKIVRDRRDI